jgi:hypothetical protein
LLATAALVVGSLSLVHAAPLPLVTGVELQPLSAQVRRLVEALEFLGAPLSDAEQQILRDATSSPDAAKAIETIQKTLDPHCLIGVQINPEMRVKAAQGEAAPRLLENGWQVFLVKIQNDSGTTAELRAVSPNAISLFEMDGPRGKTRGTTPSDAFFQNQTDRPLVRTPAESWLALELFNKPPLRKNLSGLGLEYALLQLYSRDPGKREAKLVFDVGQGTQDLGFRSEVDVLFTCAPATEVTLHVKDENAQPTTASFVLRDARGHIYPPQVKRLAPDFPFHPQVYRADGEKIKLPPGEYTVELSRGPEYLARTSALTVGRKAQAASFQLERWVDPSKLGWWSGDHHIHAAGCAHYVKPTEGVHAEDMIRHCLGEDLKVGANLTWGPCFDYQKQFFCGYVDKVSQYPYLLRYDIEVSGFGSHESGHLVLLRLKDQIYPGGTSKDHWPKLCLNTLRWAKKQGAVVGPAHSGWGLAVKDRNMPTYELPPFDGIGANEYIVDVTHEVPGPDGKLVPAVDFISTVDTPYTYELNIWYHTLNAGYRTRISGETDFPCIYGERVGLGRSYVKVDGRLDYDAWCEGIRQGRNYVSDGRSHLLNFRLNGQAMGENGSELRIEKPGTLRATFRAAAFLNEKPDKSLQNRPIEQKPYWDIERARLGDKREVPVELLVNGQSVAKKTIVADGETRELEFDVPIERSSWVALRILPSSHTNPIFVLVDGKPIRASRRSVEWCLKAVDKCWAEKERFLKKSPIDGEVEQGRADYAHAREAYKKLLAECEVD